MTSPKWSYSSIKLYEQCPKKYYHLRVAKDVVEPQTEATTYGKEFHSAAEHYVRDNTPLPPQFSFVKDALDNLKHLPGNKYCEFEMGLTRDLKPCGFKDDAVWWRGIADLLIINGDEARIVDYKTGKSAKYADTGQLELMALAVFQHFPQIKKIKAGLLFVISKNFVKASYSAFQKEELWLKWLKEYNRMLNSYQFDVWNPRPSGLCKKHCLALACPHNGQN
jgi:hypothetical protein